jgi:hypothetical protein
VAVFGWTVPSSPLSVSLVHGVQHAFNALRMVLSIPLIPFRLAYNAWKKESNTSYRDFFSTTKMLLTESLAKVLSASATVLSAVALVVLLPLKVIVGGVDQVVSRFLPKAINPSAQRRARWAAGVDNFISRAGARLSKAFGLRTLQEKTQGQQGVKGLANDFISREVPASDAASSTPIGPEEKAQRMAEVVGGARVAQRLVAQAGRTEDASGPASEGGGDLVLPVTAGRTQDASGPASEGGGIEMVSRTSDLVLPVTPMLPADGLEMVSPTSPRSATVMFASLNLTGLTSGGSPSSSPRATTPTLPGSVPDDADAPGSGSPR